MYTFFGKILHLHHNALGYKYHIFHTDIDPFRIILTLIFVANAYIIRYPYHPNKLGDVGMWGFWVGKTKYNDLHYK